MIDSLVQKYRDGDIQASETLLEVFRPLIGKYLRLFLSGIYNPNDPDIMKFISMCGSKDLSLTADILKRRLRRCEAEELIQVSKVALLDTAKFHNNIYASYKFVLHGYVMALLADDFIGDLPVAREIDTEIDAEWVSGVTSGVGFCKLSESQRLLVKMCWHDNIPDVHICRFLGLTYSQLLREKEIIKDLLIRERNINRLLGKRKKSCAKQERELPDQ
jgi:hypothetical protein